MFEKEIFTFLEDLLSGDKQYITFSKLEKNESCK